MHETFDVKIIQISVCHGADLDKQSKMIIFESNLTTFKLSVIFRSSWAVVKNWLELKTKPP